jgi:S1-C subfamily serine protease
VTAVAAVAVAIAFSILAGPGSSAQDFLPSNPQATDSDPVVVSRLRPSLPSAATAAEVAQRGAGDTLVSLDPELGSLSRGGIPQSTRELIALEKQQTKVIDRIGAVTVNIQQGAAQGSGVLITTDGYILTAAHVAGKPGRDAYVTLEDGRRLKATTLGMNRYMDAGLVKIDNTSGESFPHASLGRSKPLRVGQWVIATGHPGGWVSNRPAVMRVGRIIDLMPSTLVTDCALIGGDSGGPLFDLEGKLIGIHSRIGTDVIDNMHVPIDVFDDSWDRMAKSEAWGTLPGYKPWIGVNGSARNDVAEIASVPEGSPSDRAGIQAGDIIQRFDGRLVSNFDELIAAVNSTLPGDRVTVEIQRDGKLLRTSLIVSVKDN